MMMRRKPGASRADMACAKQIGRRVEAASGRRMRPISKGAAPAICYAYSGRRRCTPTVITNLSATPAIADCSRPPVWCLDVVDTTICRRPARTRQAYAARSCREMVASTHQACSWYFHDLNNEDQAMNTPRLAYSARVLLAHRQSKKSLCRRDMKTYRRAYTSRLEPQQVSAVYAYRASARQI